MGISLIDSHAHVSAPRFDDDREQVVERARDAGLVAILDIGTNLASSRAAVSLARRVDFVHAAVGVHPHDAISVTPDLLDALRELAQEPSVVAIGEIGLDYYRDLSPRPVQRRAFAAQLALAAELDLPVIVHSREAHVDVLAALEEWEGVGVIHSYAAGERCLAQVLDIGFAIGISGPVTFASADELRRVAAAVDIDRLLVETDCPYLTPQPHRGRRNEPSYVRYVAQAVADARGLPLGRVARATTANVRRLFNL